MLPMNNFFATQARIKFKNLDSAHQAFLQAKSISLHCHRDPDRDTVSSAHALALLGRSLGKRVQVIYPNKPGFWVDSDAPQYSESYGFVPDLAILVDSPRRDRFFLPESFTGSRIMGMDHHSGYQIDGEFNFVDSSLPSACSTVALVLSAWSENYLKVPSVAQFLLEGLLDDSQFFRIPSANVESLLLASYLIECGANFGKARERVLVRRPIRLVRFWSDVISKGEHDTKTDTFFLFCSTKLMDQYGCSEEEQKGLSSFLSGLVDIDTIAVVTQTKTGDLKVSMRSRKIDLAILCAKFGGGGHVRAAGFKATERDFLTLKNQILAAIND